jgi:hypothetical protein
MANCQTLARVGQVGRACISRICTCVAGRGESLDTAKLGNWNSVSILDGSLLVVSRFLRRFQFSSP